jgi:hypothetical protein
MGHNAQTVPPDRPGFDEAGGHLIAFELELFVGQANVIENNRFAIGEIMRIAADDIVYGKVLESHFGILSLELVSKYKVWPVGPFAGRTLKFDSLPYRATGSNYRDVILERRQNSKKAPPMADFGFRILKDISTARCTRVAESAER